MADIPAKFQIIDNPAIGEVYVNKLISASFDGGAVTVTFGSTRVMPEHDGEAPKKQQPASVYVTTRVTLSPSAAVELTNALGAMLKNLSQLRQEAAGKRDGEPSS